MWRRALIRTFATSRCLTSHRFAVSAAIAPSHSYSSNSDAAFNNRIEDVMPLPPTEHFQDHLQPVTEESKPIDVSEQFSRDSAEDTDTRLSEHVEEVQTYEIDVEKLDNVLSLLQSMTDGCLESSLDGMELVLHEDFAVKVLQQPLVLGENLIRFCKWMMMKSGAAITTRVVDALDVAICSNLEKKDAYMLWDLIKEITDEENNVLNAEIHNRLIALFSKLVFREDFVVKVLEQPLVLGENLIRFFKWMMMKPGAAITTRVVDVLAVTICSSLKKKDAYMLWDLIKEIADKENHILNAEILNRLIALFSKLGKGKAAFEVFEKFGDFACTPDSDAYYYTIEVLCRRSMFVWACSVCEKMLNTGSLPDADKVGSIISLMCKGAQTDRAHAVYMLAKEKNKYPSQSAVNFLISSLCKKDETVKLALEILSDFPAEARKRAIKPFSSVVRSLCRIKDVDEAKKLLLKMVAEGPPPGNAVFNSVVHGYSKSGDMNEAIEMMKWMESRGLKPDVYTYTVIMSGYVSGGQMEEACKMLSEAKKQHSKLTPVTYHTLIRGYCKLEQYDEALKLFSEMQEFGVQPTEDEYNKLIQSLCLNALDWATAEELSKKMQDNGLHLNGSMRGLIRAVKELEKESMKEELIA